MKKQYDILLILCPFYWIKLPPLSISYLKSYLKSKNINCLTLDLNIKFYNIADKNIQKIWQSANLQDIEILNNYIKTKIYSETNSIINKIQKYKIKFLGFSIFKSNLNISLSVSNTLKKYIPQIKTIFGGPETASLYFENNINILNNIDYLVIGEGEKNLYNIVTNKNSERLQKFNQIDDINTINFPSFKKNELKKYRFNNVIPLLFSRGCINKCFFCSEKLLFKNFRNRNAKNLIKEIKHHKKKHNITWFIFQDSLINGNIKELNNFLTILINEKIKIKWEAQFLIRNDMPENLFKLIKQSGCYNMFIGLESGSDIILKKMNKNFNTTAAYNFFKLLHKNNLHFEISLIFGYPGETEKTFQETLYFIKHNKNIIPKIAQVNPFIKYRGTIINDTVPPIEKNSYVTRFIDFLQKEKIPYTKAFINNLMI